MSNHKMTRRAFLALPALAPLASLGSGTATDRERSEHHFRYDHVIGTSMDLVVWTPDTRIAERADEAVRAEIVRLASILNTRDPESEIRKHDQLGASRRSVDLERIFSAYSHWENRTGGLFSMFPEGTDGPRNVDALGKAYIIDRAVHEARVAAPDLDGLLLNIGGDIVIWGRFCEITVADPHSPYDNAEPLTRLVLTNAAIATSGTYARGAHLRDARTGQALSTAASATVVAQDALTANALATTLCIAGEAEGMRLVESTPGAVALRVDTRGAVGRSAGFARFERPAKARPITLVSDWPEGFQLTVSLTLTEGSAGGGRGGFGGRGGRGGFGGRGGAKRPYVAIWVEDNNRKVVRVLAFWADKPRYYTEMSTFFLAMGRDQNLLANTARATRAPGSYQVVWDGLDSAGKPVPSGSYNVIVETNQEHGGYGRQKGTIVCADSPQELMLSTTPNLEAITLRYGPKLTQA